MSVTSRSIKCSECNVLTTNADYCKSCGKLISFQKKEEIREEAIKQEIVAEEQWKIDNPNWIERLKIHPFIFYRIIGYLLYSVVFVISAIGSLLAWFVAMVAAG